MVFHNIKTEDTTVTKPKQIKEEVRKHYEKWTQANPFNPEKWPEWAIEYKPIQLIDPEWFETLKNPITPSELEKTLSETPNNKATGPQNISNEMLKHFNTYAKNTFLKILNACIDLQIILKSWNQSRIYPISKKQSFSGQLKVEWLVQDRWCTIAHQKIGHAMACQLKYGTKRTTTTAKMLNNIHTANIAICQNTNATWLQPLNKEGISINTILQLMTKPHLIKSKLNKIKLKFVEQCLDYKSESMIPWFYLPHTIRTIPRGRQPNWYRQIVEMVQEIIGFQAIVPIRPNPAYMYNNTIWEKKEWITLKAHQAEFIDRISSLKKDNIALVNHWTPFHTTQNLQLCPGCRYNNPVLAKEKCTKKISLDLLQSILVDSKKKLQIQISDLRQLQTRGPEKKQKSNLERREMVMEPQYTNVIEKIETSGNPSRRSDEEAVKEEIVANTSSTFKALAQLYNAELSERI
ncbi:41635_t:CDS:2, partial [Gigaspora margarita]